MTTTPTVRRALAALLVLPLLAGATSASAAPSQHDRHGVHSTRHIDAGDWTLVGHRGSPAANATENTLASFDRAYAQNSTAIEFDIVPTSDRKYLVMHDATLDRTTTCDGLVPQRTLAAIQRACKGKNGGQRIPSITQALGWAARRGMNVIVEIKHHPDYQWTADDMAAIAHRVDAAHMSNRVIYHGLNNDDLRLMKATVPTAHVQAIAPNWTMALRQAEWADGINVYADDLTPARVEFLHSKGLLVLGRATDAAQDWKRLLAVGADGLLTDTPGTYAGWLRKAKQQ